MVLFCCVVGCSNRAQRDPVRFFRIPAVLQHKHREDLNALSRLRREKWLKAIKRADLDEKRLKYTFVCSSHFVGGEPAALTETLSPDWVPSVNMGYISIQTPQTRTLNRYNRKKARIEVIGEPSSSKQHDSLTADDSTNFENALMENEKLVQTDMTSADMIDMKLSLTSAIKMKEILLKRVTDYMTILSDDFKLRYYTGFTSKPYLEQVVEIIEPFIKMTQNTLLPAREQILLTLIKLRLNLDFKDLAFRFGISPTTASTYFKNVINIMCVRLCNFVFWPERDVIKKTMPACFKEAFHDNTTVIIDCFEIRTQTPASLLTAAQSWSNYKHSQTVKYLIGITPQGSVCYISEGWGGRASDKCITENSSFLMNLQMGDVIMADRGFLIREFVELFQATVKIPAFVRGKTQLHPVDLEKTRSLAHCRIHVERIIGFLKQKYTILQDVVPIVLISTGGEEPIFDKIVFVCCALINLCPAIIPQ